MYKTELDWVSAYKKLEAELEHKNAQNTELEKENAELKRRNKAVETTLKLNSKFMKSKLTEAKEIIQTLIDSLEVSEGEEIRESKVVKEAEQFLKEK